MRSRTANTSASIARRCLERPDWTVGADLDKSLAVETRKRLLSQAADEQFLIAGYHFPFPGVGVIRRLGDGFRYVPVPLV